MTSLTKKNEIISFRGIIPYTHRWWLDLALYAVIYRQEEGPWNRDAFLDLPSLKCCTKYIRELVLRYSVVMAASSFLLAVWLCFQTAKKYTVSILLLVDEYNGIFEAISLQFSSLVFYLDGCDAIHLICKRNWMWNAPVSAKHCKHFSPGQE